jgi:SOS-response transcriptional repressor LexA
MSIEIAQKIIGLRESKGMHKKTDLAEKSGLDASYISRLEAGDFDYLRKNTLDALAGAFEMPTEKLKTYLYGDSTPAIRSDDDDFFFKLDKRIKVLPIQIRGYVNAGTPALAEAVDLGVVYVERDKISGVKKMEAVFALKISGDSLKGDNINNSDIVIIEPHPDLIEGKIYIIRLDNEVVARHVHRENGFAVLTSSNGKYARIEVDKLEVIGRVIGAQNPDYRMF